jgi:DNA (cytosine-5)-methyltransferase 1
MTNPIKIIDLFAGPGGLGEGFSALKRDDGSPAFKIQLSIEKEEFAHKTLMLRAFYRQFSQGGVPDIYYEYLEGYRGMYREGKFSKEVFAAKREAQRLTLGEDNKKIHNLITDALGKKPGPWVLIGGPPCQAYSIAGRSRNKGVKNYCAEEDHRNYLYREYLEIIARFRPAVFVMENVKGMLSAKVGGEHIFSQIKEDLACPAIALNLNEKRIEYDLFTLSPSKKDLELFKNGDLQPRDFIIEAERHGIPQARHRVIIVGIQKKISGKNSLKPLSEKKKVSTRKVVSNLPKLRSGLSKEADTFENWVDAVRHNEKSLVRNIRKYGLTEVAEKYEDNVSRIGESYFHRGTNWGSGAGVREFGKTVDVNLINWYQDDSGWRGACNHETRAHIKSDLQRYLFCASYAQVNRDKVQVSPKADTFPDMFWPNHQNWKTGHFNDRFRVQPRNRVATTVTSHISKDGHYFIHYDPSQCRSLTVREAARIQTFPDNYFFVGTRTSQYVQVGNAVPPYLANQIAEQVYAFLKG